MRRYRLPAALLLLLAGAAVAASLVWSPEPPAATPTPGQPSSPLSPPVSDPDGRAACGRPFTAADPVAWQEVGAQAGRSINESIAFEGLMLSDWANLAIRAHRNGQGAKEESAKAEALNTKIRLQDACRKAGYST